MSTSDWHCGSDLLTRYVEDRVDLALAASVEAHLIGCAVCRAELAGLPMPAGPDLEQVWHGVRETIARPALPVPLRLLRRCGLGESDAVLLSASQSLRGPWVLATAAVLVFAVLASWRGGPLGLACYLLVAPLAPLVGVVGAFAASDPMVELTNATPYSKPRLALLRTAAVTVTTVPLVVALGSVVPGVGLLSVAWLAPALGLTLVALAALTWGSADVVGGVLALVWTGIVAVSYRRDDLGAAVAQQAQLGYLVVAALAAVVLVARIRTAHTPGGPA